MSTAATEGKPLGKKAMQEIGFQDELKKWGWRVEHLKSGIHAVEINGDRRIGPASTLKALHTQVSLAAGPVVEKKPANGKGNGKNVAGESASPAPQRAEQRLPSMEEPEIDELNALADACIDAKAAKEKANATFKDQCDVMRENMRTFKRKRYTRDGFTLTIEDSEKLVIKKAEQAPPKNPSTKNQRNLSLV